MPANFEYLQEYPEYTLFADACIEAERVLATSPAMAAMGSRKACELAVKWVYFADNTITMPYRDNLQSLIHEPSFRFALDNQTWSKLPYIIKLGNSLPRKKSSAGLWRSEPQDTHASQPVMLQLWCARSPNRLFFLV